MLDLVHKYVTYSFYSVYESDWFACVSSKISCGSHGFDLNLVVANLIVEFSSSSVNVTFCTAIF